MRGFLRREDRYTHLKQGRIVLRRHGRGKKQYVAGVLDAFVSPSW